MNQIPNKIISNKSNIWAIILKNKQSLEGSRSFIFCYAKNKGERPGYFYPTGKNTNLHI